MNSQIRVRKHAGRIVACGIYNFMAGVTGPIYDYNHCRTGDIAKTQVKRKTKDKWGDEQPNTRQKAHGLLYTPIYRVWHQIASEAHVLVYPPIYRVWHQIRVRNTRASALMVPIIGLMIPPKFPSLQIQ